MPNRGVLRMAAAGLNRPHHGLAGVGPDPDLERRLALASELLGVAPHLLLHPQRRIERAQGMVLVRDWSAEQRKDAITGRLHNVAVVVIYGIDHQLQSGIYQGARLFWIQTFQQFGRTSNIGEERSDRFPLAV